MEQIIEKLNLQIKWSKPFSQGEISRLQNYHGFYAFLLSDHKGLNVVKIGAGPKIKSGIEAHNKGIWNYNLRVVYSVIPKSFIDEMQNLIRVNYPDVFHDQYSFAFRMVRVLWEKYLKKWRQKPPVNKYVPIKRDYLKHIEIEEMGDLSIMKIPPAQITPAYAGLFECPLRIRQSYIDR